MKVKEITLKVKSVQLLTGRGQDEVCLNFDDSVPTPYPACGYEGGANIRCQAHHGMQWCKDALGLDESDVEVIQVSDLSTHFSTY